MTTNICCLTKNIHIQIACIFLYFLCIFTYQHHCSHEIRVIPIKISNIDQLLIVKRFNHKNRYYPMNNNNNTISHSNTYETYIIFQTYVEFKFCFVKPQFWYHRSFILIDCMRNSNHYHIYRFFLPNIPFCPSVISIQNQLSNTLSQTNVNRIFQLHCILFTLSVFYACRLSNSSVNMSLLNIVCFLVSIGAFQCSSFILLLFCYFVINVFLNHNHSQHITNKPLCFAFFKLCFTFHFQLYLCSNLFHTIYFYFLPSHYPEPQPPSVH